MERRHGDGLLTPHLLKERCVSTGRRINPQVFSFPSGKQLFERDRNLDTSDIQFLEDGNSALASCRTCR